MQLVNGPLRLGKDVLIRHFQELRLCIAVESISNNFSGQTRTSFLQFCSSNKPARGPEIIHYGSITVISQLEDLDTSEMTHYGSVVAIYLLEDHNTTELIHCGSVAVIHLLEESNAAEISHCGYVAQYTPLEDPKTAIL